MISLFAAPFFLQGLAIFFDEFYFHRRRGLPTWERIGHPLDTLTVGISFAFVLYVPYSSNAGFVYLAIASFSCLFVTKDEWIHEANCSGKEMWLHSVLFVLHPVVLMLAGFIWFLKSHSQISEMLGWRPSDLALAWFTLEAQLAIVFVFFLFQLVYWNLPWKQKRS